MLSNFQLWFRKSQIEAMRWYFLITLSMLILALISCSRPSQPVSSTSGRNDDLIVDLWASSDCVQVNELVKLRTTVTNHSTKAQVFETKDQPVLDIVFGNPDSPFQRWSNGKALTSDMTHLELKPGESKSVEMDWVPDGSRRGGVHVWARFVSPTRPYFQNPSVTVQVQYCVGPLGP